MHKTNTSEDNPDPSGGGSNLSFRIASVPAWWSWATHNLTEIASLSSRRISLFSTMRRSRLIGTVKVDNFDMILIYDFWVILDVILAYESSQNHPSTLTVPIMSPAFPVSHP